MSQQTARFIVGIDLGTTNSAVAYVDTAEPRPAIQMLRPPQVVAPGTVEERPTLPSFLYLASAAEFPAGALALPWPTDGEPEGSVVGELARSHGAQVPMRLVSSAKSWLCHSGVDRTAPLLPFGAPAEVPKVSPVAASARYLSHVRAAWNARFREAPLEAQEVLVTVPASFDAIARELTVEAAVKAGLKKITLLEEPQAAFYSWLGVQGDGWRTQLEVGDVVLVCDVGGGTTDFSLIEVSAEDGNLQLERVAVGDHILLGGDNMDLALGHSVKARLEAEGHKLDAWQLQSLVHACRGAKEQLLSGDKLAEAPVVILGRGSKVIGGSIKTSLPRSDVEALLLDGFFPACAEGAQPRRDRRVGLKELGLPFAADAAITRHLAAFVTAHKAATCVLYNGGVMKGTALRRRITETLDSWSDSPDSDLKVLEGTDLDLAVAHGAAYYGLVRRGQGVRIRGGTARAYYIGIETAMPAVPGMAPPLKALCVAPFGMEEGSEAEVADREFGLVVGEPAEFRFLASTTRPDDHVGTLIEEVGEDLAELEPVSTSLGEAAKTTANAEVVPVHLRSHVTEVGTLELWCVEVGGARRWKLEYNVREGRPAAG
jgi:molecular chaperone DnaK (HSP70)